MARFGKNKTKPFDDLRECVNSIFTAAQMHFTLLKSQNEESGSEAEESKREEMNQFMADIYWGDKDRDRITTKIEEAVKEMEEICKKIIGIK